MRYILIGFFIILVMASCNNEDDTESNYFDTTAPFGRAGGIYATGSGS